MTSRRTMAPGDKGGASTPLAIVVIDTESTLRWVAQEFQRNNWRVLTFLSGVDALNAPELAEAALVVSDVSNRPLKGIDLWHALRDRQVSVPFAFLSPYASEMAALFEGVTDRPVAYWDIPLSARAFGARLIDLARDPRGEDAGVVRP